MSVHVNHVVADQSRSVGMATCVLSANKDLDRSIVLIYLLLAVRLGTVNLGLL